jgi:tRNA-(ms[2]io[6]A)-hydroxylase
MPMSILHYQTPPAWLDAVLDDFDRFLQDHASAEKKAAGMAVTMISHYHDRRELVSLMSDLAVEEMTHYREVIRLLHERDVHPAADAKDAYVAALRKAIRKGPDFYLLDQLLIAGIIEARGAERFGLIAQGLPAGRLKDFYQAITRSEERHHELFFKLAKVYFASDPVDQRLRELLAHEAEICAGLPIRAALH